jgi:hypothetical protein
MIECARSLIYTLNASPKTYLPEYEVPCRTRALESNHIFYHQAPVPDPLISENAGDVEAEIVYFPRDQSLFFKLAPNHFFIASALDMSAKLSPSIDLSPLHIRLGSISCRHLEISLPSPSSLPIS